MPHSSSYSYPFSLCLSSPLPFLLWPPSLLSLLLDPFSALSLLVSPSYVPSFSSTLIMAPLLLHKNKLQLPTFSRSPTFPRQRQAGSL
ncbi:hypothetical protein GDO81_006302 [Engystomops pustulosus]|uniref:Uncharacterized protein n=1 Tax=Engystomops pustulosus TaxID=76066 RepID=A0AAV7CYW4_ENGPU|nr:hypothetical protein GDO81_006302 [Engystomops pustulosus]